MKADLAISVLRSITRARLIRPGDRVGVAVSGGADSVALLRLLIELRGDLGITLSVLHFDHALRNESREDARFVEALARSQGLPFISERADVAAVAKRNKWNLEDAGRRLRYEFFNGVVGKGLANRIAVAHTMDDQAETVLARIFRGTGPAGLVAIYPVSGAVVRPLLGIRREALRGYLSAIGQAWREDATNLDTLRQRAKIRKELLPYLERNFSPGIVGHLAQLARLCREEEVFWTALADDRFQQLVKQSGNRFAIPVKALLHPLPVEQGQAPSPIEAAEAAEPQRSLTERLIRRLYREARGSTQGLTALHVEQVLRLAQRSQSGRRVELPGGVLAERGFKDIAFSRPRRKPGSTRGNRNETDLPCGAYHYVVKFGDSAAAEIRVPELGTCFRLKVIDWPSAQRETSPGQSFFDRDRLLEPLVLRSWGPGDSYRPSGHRRIRKLKEMFVARRVAANRRRAWPVLESCGRVIWARGMGPAHEVCAGRRTRMVVSIEESEL